MKNNMKKLQIFTKKYIYFQRSDSKNKVWILEEDIINLIPKEKLPIEEKNINDKYSNFLTAGWNEYRKELLKKLGILQVHL